MRDSVQAEARLGFENAAHRLLDLRARDLSRRHRRGDRLRPPPRSRGESRITSTPAFTALTAASPAEAIFTIAAIFIESV